MGLVRIEAAAVDSCHDCGHAVKSDLLHEKFGVGFEDTAHPQRTGRVCRVTKSLIAEREANPHKARLAVKVGRCAAVGIAALAHPRVGIVGLSTKADRAARALAVRGANTVAILQAVFQQIPQLSAAHQICAIKIASRVRAADTYKVHRGHPVDVDQRVAESLRVPLEVGSAIGSTKALHHGAANNNGPTIFGATGWARGCVRGRNRGRWWRGWWRRGRWGRGRRGGRIKLPQTAKLSIGAQLRIQIGARTLRVKIVGSVVGILPTEFVLTACTIDPLAHRKVGRSRIQAKCQPAVSSRVAH